MSAEFIILKAKKDCGKAGERSEKVQIDKQHPLSRISDAAGIQSFLCVCAVAHSTRGHIYLDGKEIRSYSKEEYWKILGVVFQDFALIGLPLAENSTVR